MASFLKVTDKYRNKSQGKGAVPMTPDAQGSSLTAKLFLFLLCLTHAELLAQWRKEWTLQPELQAGSGGLGGICWYGFLQAVLVLGRYAEALEDVRAPLRCSYRSLTEEKNSG